MHPAQSTVSNASGATGVLSPLPLHFPPFFWNQQANVGAPKGGLSSPSSAVLTFFNFALNPPRRPLLPTPHDPLVPSLHTVPDLSRSFSFLLMA